MKSTEQNITMSDFIRAKKALEKANIKGPLYLVTGSPKWFTRELVEEQFPSIEIIDGVEVREITTN